MTTRASTIQNAIALARQHYADVRRGVPTPAPVSQCLQAIRWSDSDLASMLQRHHATHWAVPLALNGIFTLPKFAREMFGEHDEGEGRAALKHVPARSDDELWNAARGELEVLGLLCSAVGITKESDGGEISTMAGWARAVIDHIPTLAALCNLTYDELARTLEEHLRLTRQSTEFDAIVGLWAVNSAGDVRKEFHRYGVDLRAADLLKDMDVLCCSELTPDIVRDVQERCLTRSPDQAALMKLARDYRLSEPPSPERGDDIASLRQRTIEQRGQPGAWDTAALASLCDDVVAAELGSALDYTAERVRSTPTRAALDHLGDRLLLLHQAHSGASEAQPTPQRVDGDFWLDNSAALRGVAANLTAEEQGGQQPHCNLFRDPGHVIFERPQSHPQLHRLEFGSRNALTRFQNRLRNHGLTAAMQWHGGDDGADAIAGHMIVVEMLVLPITSFEQPEESLLLSEVAARTARGVKCKATAREMLCKFGHGAHVGTRVLGGILMRVVKATGNGATEENLRLAADRVMSWSPSESESDARFSCELVQATEHVSGVTIEVSTRAQSHGPSETAPGNFVQKLVEGTSPSLCFVERGTEILPLSRFVKSADDALARAAASYLCEECIDMLRDAPVSLEPWAEQLAALAERDQRDEQRTELREQPSDTDTLADETIRTLKRLLTTKVNECTDEERSCRMPRLLRMVTVQVYKAASAAAHRDEFLQRLFNGPTLQVWVRAAAYCVSPRSQYRAEIAEGLQKLLPSGVRDMLCCAQLEHVERLFADAPVAALLADEGHTQVPATREVHTHEEMCAAAANLVEYEADDYDLSELNEKLGGLLQDFLNEATLGLLDENLAEKRKRERAREMLYETYGLDHGGFRSPMQRDRLLYLLRDLRELTTRGGPVVDEEEDGTQGIDALDAGVFERDDWHRVDPPSGLVLRVDGQRDLEGPGKVFYALHRRGDLKSLTGSSAGPVAAEAEAEAEAEGAASALGEVEAALGDMAREVMPDAACGALAFVLGIMNGEQYQASVLNAAWESECVTPELRASPGVRVERVPCYTVQSMGTREPNGPVSSLELCSRPGKNGEVLTMMERVEVWRGSDGKPDGARFTCASLTGRGSTRCVGRVPHGVPADYVSPVRATNDSLEVVRNAEGDMLALFVVPDTQAARYTPRCAS